MAQLILKPFLGHLEMVAPSKLEELSGVDDAGLYRNFYSAKESRWNILRVLSDLGLATDDFEDVIHAWNCVCLALRSSSPGCFKYSAKTVLESIFSLIANGARVDGFLVLLHEWIHPLIFGRFVVKNEERREKKRKGRESAMIEIDLFAEARGRVTRPEGLPPQAERYRTDFEEYRRNLYQLKKGIRG